MLTVTRVLQQGSSSQWYSCVWLCAIVRQLLFSQCNLCFVLTWGGQFWALFHNAGLKPVHTKNDNCNDSYKIALSQVDVGDHTTPVMATNVRNNILGITFRAICSSCMNDRNTDSQNPIKFTGRYVQNGKMT